MLSLKATTLHKSEKKLKLVKFHCKQEILLEYNLRRRNNFIHLLLLNIAMAL